MTIGSKMERRIIGLVLITPLIVGASLLVYHADKPALIKAILGTVVLIVVCALFVKGVELLFSKNS